MGETPLIHCIAVVIFGLHGLYAFVVAVSMQCISARGISGLYTVPEGLQAVTTDLVRVYIVVFGCRPSDPTLKVHQSVRDGDEVAESHRTGVAKFSLDGSCSCRRSRRRRTINFDSELSGRSVGFGSRRSGRSGRQATSCGRKL
ncbi:uncharacterized protein LOC127566373 [Drosophila albomicans]|uniref:Uncharacterized protein LOC127566373 n=1 Tax=Drosophila albomicans TaxID=7291 RepID=A0A9C6WJ81_DROAB|nr:uncharacterized protein LOC127566373 [Drosophila albomicans]